MKRLAIIGSGDLAQQMIHHAKASGRYLPVCLFDDFATIGEAKIWVKCGGVQ
jgi:FlaA1/EpsC-like NDP-sugar epimerase